MNEDREQLCKEWHEYRDKFDAIIEDPELLLEYNQRDYFYPFLRMWIHDIMSGYHQVWVIYKTRSTENISPERQINPFIRNAIWHKSKARYCFLYADEETKKAGLETAFTVKDAEIDLSSLESHLEELAKIKLPIFFRDYPYGCDGGYYGLEFHTNYTDGFGTKIVWWCDPPDEWKELTDWFNKTKAYLESHFEK